MNYASLITKSYGQGRLCVSTDRINNVPYSDNPVFWRNLLEWISQKSENDIITIGILNSAQIDYWGRLLKIPNIMVVDFNSNILENIDIVYYIGLPSSFSVDMGVLMENFVENGGGIFVEVPDIGDSNINVLTPFDDVFCYSNQIPVFSKSYWTLNGYENFLYAPDFSMGFFTTIGLDDIPVGWDVWMSDIETSFQEENVIEIEGKEFEVIGNIGSSFGISYIVAMQNGMIELTET